MRFLFELYHKYRFWLIFIFLETLSMVTLVKNNRYQGSVYFTTANSMVGAWYSFTSGISSFFEMKAENDRLEHENEMLRKRLNDLRSGLREDENTIEMLSEKNRDLRNYDYVGAHIGWRSIAKRIRQATVRKNQDALPYSRRPTAQRGQGYGNCTQECQQLLFPHEIKQRGANCLYEISF